MIFKFGLTKYILLVFSLAYWDFRWGMLFKCLSAKSYTLDGILWGRFVCFPLQSWIILLDNFLFCNTLIRFLLTWYNVTKKFWHTDIDNLPYLTEYFHTFRVLSNFDATAWYFVSCNSIQLTRKLSWNSLFPHS